MRLYVWLPTITRDAYMPVPRYQIQAQPAYPSGAFSFTFSRGAEPFQLSSHLNMVDENYSEPAEKSSLKNNLYGKWYESDRQAWLASSALPSTAVSVNDRLHKTVP